MRERNRTRRHWGGPRGPGPVCEPEWDAPRRRASWCLAPARGHGLCSQASEAVSQKLSTPRPHSCSILLSHTAFSANSAPDSAGKRTSGARHGSGTEKRTGQEENECGPVPNKQDPVRDGPASWPISHICSIRAIGRPARPAKRPISVSFFLGTGQEIVRGPAVRFPKVEPRLNGSTGIELVVLCLRPVMAVRPEGANHQ